MREREKERETEGEREREREGDKKKVESAPGEPPTNSSLFNLAPGQGEYGRLTRDRHIAVNIKRRGERNRERTRERERKREKRARRTT